MSETAVYHPLYLVEQGVSENDPGVASTYLALLRQQIEQNAQFAADLLLPLLEKKSGFGTTQYVKKSQEAVQQATFFFIFVVDFYSFARLGAEKRNLLSDTVVPDVIGDIISAQGVADEKTKKTMWSKLFDELNAATGDYAKEKAIFDEKKMLSGNAAFPKFVRKMEKIAGIEKDFIFHMQLQLPLTSFLAILNQAQVLEHAVAEIENAPSASD